MANPNGRPRSETVKLTKTARERFDRQLAEKLPDIFTALFEAGTKDKDTAALSLLVNRAVPVRKGVPVNFETRPLSNPTECAEAFGDILAAIGRGELTPDEGNMIGALIERRANLFQTVELQDEIAALKAQIAGLVVTPPRPGSHDRPVVSIHAPVRGRAAKIRHHQVDQAGQGPLQSKGRPEHQYAV